MLLGHSGNRKTLPFILQKWNTVWRNKPQCILLKNSILCNWFSESCFSVFRHPGTWSLLHPPLMGLAAKFELQRDLHILYMVLILQLSKNARVVRTGRLLLRFKKTWQASHCLWEGIVWTCENEAKSTVESPRHMRNVEHLLSKVHRVIKVSLLEET